MFQFFSGAIKAGLNTAQSLLLGPSKTRDEMYAAQKSRYHAVADFITNLHYKPHQNLARKQYWCSQTYFLGQLIKNNSEKIQEITQLPVSVASESALLETINHLISALDAPNNVNKFLKLLEYDLKTVETTPLQPSIQRNTSNLPLQSGIQLVHGDVIQLIKQLNDQGVIVITDNAPNSHRDGAAKYSSGSVEELFSRYTDSALKMALHFCDVHQRNIESNQYAFSEQPYPIDVVEYQKRYLKMVLTICAKLVEKKETYLESEAFFNDLFKSYPNPQNGLPIYFDMQNNVYEVPVGGGSISSHWFADTSEITTVEKTVEQLQKNEKTPMTIVSYAAPDLRKVETSPLDTRSTSNKILQHPEAEGTLGLLLTTGIAAQCQAAINRATYFKEHGINQAVAAVFVMPGCGAFNNPEKQSAAQFISAIKYYYPELEKLGIHCYIAEYNQKLYKVLAEANDSFNSELGQLNETIIRMTDPELRAKAITVKEKILELYAKGEQSELLIKHITQTTQLLTMPPSPKRHALTLEYQKNANLLSKNNNSVLQSLGFAMMVLGLAVMVVGVSFALTGVGLLTSGAITAGGFGLLATGIGLFSNEKKKNIATLSENLRLSCI
ncbi:hypothetical protein Lgra_0731 [Legionella gratiana]|uniref:Uncharacterized protein n=1 Tax=Legionella gratiana TaxID=45066 RepID=A0A378JGX8_9GAMM|nr:hypothetical protein [Legionella gratiana]KTD14121.1 hypothetical protein Lgra_0731 [Legionella gratiana]STX46251.1 Uncharacterised protein [Legionella gratiana]